MAHWHTLASCYTRVRLQSFHIVSTVSVSWLITHKMQQALNTGGRTLRDLKPGMNLCTGSSRRKVPSSTKDINAVAVIGFIIEYLGLQQAKASAHSCCKRLHQRLLGSLQNRLAKLPSKKGTYRHAVLLVLVRKARQVEKNDFSISQSTLCKAREHTRFLRSNCSQHCSQLSV